MRRMKLEPFRFIEGGLVGSRDGGDRVFEIRLAKVWRNGVLRDGPMNFHLARQLMRWMQEGTATARSYELQFLRQRMFPIRDLVFAQRVKPAVEVQIAGDQAVDFRPFLRAHWLTSCSGESSLFCQTGACRMMMIFSPGLVCRLIASK